MGARLYLITDRRLAAPRSLTEVCGAALDAAERAGRTGTVAIQLREKDLAARDLYDLAASLRPLCRRYDAPLLINDRIDVALAAGADGVHLAHNSLGCRQAREMLGVDRLIGMSTHQPSEIDGAAREGADFVVYGPVFDPQSKAALGPSKGTEDLKKICGAAPLPVLALGGITPQRTVEIASSGAAGVALIGSVMAAEDPALEALAMLRALDGWQLRSGVERWRCSG